MLDHSVELFWYAIIINVVDIELCYSYNVITDHIVKEIVLLSLDSFDAPLQYEEELCKDGFI